MVINKPSSSSVLDSTYPPFVGAVIAVSTGGPQTLRKFLGQLTPQFGGTILIVQHGPAWALQSMARRLNKEYEFNIELAAHEMKTQSNHIYLAPGDTHLVINPRNHCLELNNNPREHALRPAADPLFRSAAKAFGKYCVSVVLTGLGRDGTAGIKVISESGGTVLIQDPKTSIASYMPQAAIDSGVKHQVVSLEKMAETLLKNISNLNKKLNKNKHSN